MDFLVLVVTNLSANLAPSVHYTEQTETVVLDICKYGCMKYSILLTAESALFS